MLGRYDMSVNLLTVRLNICYQSYLVVVEVEYLQVDHAGQV